MATNPYTSSTMNPYLQQMGQAITSTANQNLQRNILPSIGRNAVAMGGFGDSRQGIAQGIAMGDTSQGITNALANLYGGAYETDRNRQLQQYGIDTNAALTRSGQDLQRYGIDTNANLTQRGQDQGFYTAQRGQDLSQQGQQFNQYLAALNAQMGMGQAMTNIGQQQFQQGFNPYQMFGGLLNQFTGLNQQQQNQGPSTGGGLGGALGGGLSIAQLLKLLGG